MKEDKKRNAFRYDEASQTFASLCSPFVSRLFIADIDSRYNRGFRREKRNCSLNRQPTEWTLKRVSSCFRLRMSQRFVFLDWIKSLSCAIFSVYFSLYFDEFCYSAWRIWNLRATTAQLSNNYDFYNPELISGKFLFIFYLISFLNSRWSCKFQVFDQSLTILLYSARMPRQVQGLIEYLGKTCVHQLQLYI